ncbi:universal stress protein [Methylobacterium sp. CM6247]
MAFSSVMVPLDPGALGLARLKLAVGLAQLFEARLIGIAARQALPQHLYGRGALIDSRFVDQASSRLCAELSQLAARFQEASADLGAAEWRSAKIDPMTFLVQQARSADLVIVSRYQEEGNEDWCSCIAPGELVLRLGRPVLVVPETVKAITPRRIVIAWKDTREARRAVSDSLPFMKAAEEVLVVALGNEADWASARAIQAYLAQHGIASTMILRPSLGGNVATQILAIVQQEDADLIVAGAYGHTRVREVIFGSVTRTLLERTPICCLMSH